ncbi:MAG: UvrD-helicase domain-containing protein [Deltaproteobacteria bacterium]|nr:UvrD-helicase domain-containing protein [Deltaproteobacteria bacterium]MDQ3298050.1 UvrD-helicase domain-containing protein [Myxococcota bacterium]
MAVDLGKLNEPQRDAAGHGGGPLLVLAGAGSGKTRVITYRIAHLLAGGIPPEAICAVTFTNKAAEEMRERVASLVRDAKIARALTIGTFHALGLHILRSERKALGMPRGFTIYDQSDQMGALREAMRSVKDMSRDGERRFDVKAILTRISLAKNAFVAPDEYEGNPADDYDSITAQVYPKYQEMLRSCAAFDFDDLIVEPARLFERDAEVGRRWSERFRFVMVDEFQDTNAAQLRMVRHLVADHGNLCVVGDDDQSIYSWRGADPTNILRFAELFPGAKIVKLEQNYRSTKTILAAANTVIANNKQRHGKQLWSHLGDGEIITHAVAATPEDEAKWVAAEIHQLKKDGRGWADIAVMYRSNIQAKIIEEELRTASIPYVMYGGQQFFERKEVKDLLAYMRVAVNPRDELALRRIINYPARGIGATTVDRLVTAAHGRHATLWDALRGVITGTGTLPGMDNILPLDDADEAKPVNVVDVGDLRGAARNGIIELVHVVSELAGAIADGVDLVTATRTLIEDIKLYDDLRHAAGSMAAAQRRIDNVEGLLGALQRFTEKGRGKEELAEYLRMLSLENTKDDKEDTSDRVVLTTLHGAKGLEFPVCFMVGLEEELLPHARTLQPQATDVTTAGGIDVDHATDISEERRLCYVGITRAQRKLYLTRACTRVSRGRTVPRTPSRFLLEIPDELLEVRDIASEQRAKVPRDEVASFFANFAFDD